MATPFERVKAAWGLSNRESELNRVVEAMASEGVTRDELDNALGQLLDEVRDAGADDETEEIINNVGDRLHGWCHESRRISAETSAQPTQEEIAKLPRWAQVAFAARCARRVLPLFSHRWPDAPENYATRLTWAVEVGERSAAHAGAGEDWAPPAGALTCAAYVCDAVTNASRDRARAIEVIRHTVTAVTKFKDRAENIFDPHIGEVFHAITSHTIGVIANHLAISQETFNAAVREANTIVRGDFEHLVRLAAGQHWSNETPVPPDVFGPMWPNGAPKSWPKDLSKNHDQPIAGDMTVRSIVGHIVQAVVA
ncbi:unnamed protein product [Gemmata massiliana]|uniref:Uncharacterized protein n=1 Tax=Gemmata massiliana TaxID=1210884 RepID=A0A6P2CPF2_9BACT|nr:hypothetical protein [Gemmata massiliana]VTR90898.1 unnamed protein product [Gemmata massiliana]